MPSAVTHQSHIRSPDEVTASVRPLPTPLSWSPIDSTRNFGVKGNQRPDPPTARDRPFMQPAGNVTLSNYSPDRNPDEGLNGDLKQAVTAKPLARSKGQLKQAVVNHMRSLSKRPARIRSFFHHPQFRYAA